MKALGMIEVYGYLAAVEALDSALKAANVNLVDVTLVQGGLVTVLINGDVGAVKAAMDASKTAAERVGRVISVHVIPRPSKEIEKIIPFHSPDGTPLSGDTPLTESIASPEDPSAPDTPPVPGKHDNITPTAVHKPQPELNDKQEAEAEVSVAIPATKVIEDVVEEAKSDMKAEKTLNAERVKNEGKLDGDGYDKLDRDQITLDSMMGMTVDQLRKLARELDITNMTRKQIRFATKHELIESISKFIEEER
jgi:ethanolamine utilization protein EutM